MRDAVKLTTYLGERDRSGGRFTADVLIDLYERHEIAQSVLLRGIAGFGSRQHLRTARLLTLSEDLPIVSIAVDTRERVEALLPDVRAIEFDGLVTVEGAAAGTRDVPAEAKLTVWLGRHRRPTHVDVVDGLRRRGVAGATVLLGVDGTAGGERRRARLIGANADVPKLVIAVGDGNAIAAAAADLPDDAIVTVERVTVLKRDGGRLADPPSPPPGSGEQFRRKLTLYAGEQSRHDGRPLYLELIRRLRASNAPGVTAVRGVWGYHGDHAPHGDRMLALARRVPVVVSMVDDADRGARLFDDVFDPLTAAGGLVTSEWVPVAERATLHV
jgi:PII-like signaling protein